MARNLTPRYLPKRVKTAHTKTFMPQTGNNSNVYQLVNGWPIGVQWNTTIKRIGLEVQWHMILRSIIFNEWGQKQNTIHCMIPLVWLSVIQRTDLPNGNGVCGVGRKLSKSRRAFLENTEMAYNWIVVADPWVYVSVKTHHAEHLKRVNFTVCKLHLN